MAASRNKKTFSQNKVNLRQIAEQTGVSISTVSRVMSGYAHVAPETREKVLKAAEKARYRPNLLVRGMQTGSTQTIGVILPVTDSFHAAILRGIHDTLTAADRVPIVVWPVTGEGTPGAEELDQIHRLVDRRVDGVILRPTNDQATDEYLHEIHERRIPLVAVDRELLNSRADFVGSDDYAMGLLAAETFLQAGHRRLGHIAGPGFTSTGRNRRAGFEAGAAGQNGASCLTRVEDTFRYGLETARELLSQSDPPTAIFAANDHLALQVYEAAAERGLQVGRDVAVIGCGNLEFGPHLRPGLTTFDQHPYRIGCEAARLLLSRDGNPPENSAHERRLLPPALLRRGSCGVAEGASHGYTQQCEI